MLVDMLMTCKKNDTIVRFVGKILSQSNYINIFKLHNIYIKPNASFLPLLLRSRYGASPRLHTRSPALGS